MKVNYIKTTILASAMSLMCSCIGDLDVMPLDPNIMTAEDAYSTPESYLQGLKKIYSVWALSGQDNAGASDLEGMDAGNTVLLRCWWTLQEHHRTTHRHHRLHVSHLQTYAVAAHTCTVFLSRSPRNGCQQGNRC